LLSVQWLRITLVRLAEVDRLLMLEPRVAHLTVQNFGLSLHSTCIPLNMRISTGMLPMANDAHVALLKQGVAAWNAWRKQNPDIRPDLS